MASVPLEPHRHARGLTEAAARALGEGLTEEAFRLIDRRCRIEPHAEAADHLLRAACLSRMGEAEAALADLRAAHAIDPDTVVASRWLLDAPEPADREAGARALLRVAQDPADLARALACLGAGRPAVASLRETAEGLSGWVAWRGEPVVTLGIGSDGQEERVTLKGDPAHPLALCLGHAAAFRHAWPEGAEIVTVALDRPGALVEGRVFARSRFRPVRRREPGPAPAPSARVTVVVPVFADYAATALCLGTLLADRPLTRARRIVAIDDATPDPRIAALLDGLAAAGSLTLLRNPANLGFALSVNRGLAEAGEDDVLVLNADTVVPPGFLDRLARAAHAAPDIGTVTPLSNNGENTSLPVRFVENPLPDEAEIRRIDSCAAATAPSRIVDMPNGTGFCLYVRADCLAATGPVGTQYGRGYLEDVDLCLRAVAAGFRNVCAADVYVGHAGSRSFGAEKRALVVRNLASVEAAFPGYDRLCAAFFAADPLRDAIAAIEERLLAAGPPVHLAIVPEEADPALASHRLDRLRARRPRLLVACIATAGDRLAVALRDAGGGLPQSIRLAAAGPEALAARLARLPVGGATLVVPEGATPALGAALARLGLPLDTLAAEPEPVARSAAPRGLAGAPGLLALLAPPPDAAWFRLLAEVARLWTGRADLPRLLVLGATADDLRLMALGDVFVTGSCATGEIAALLRRHGATAVAAPGARAADHPYRAIALRSGLPVALPGADGLAPGDLAVPSGDDPSATARLLAGWCRRAAALAA